jgi:hypothetical protein
MITNKVMFAALAVSMAVALSVVAIAPALVTQAEARISCTNGGGNEPRGNCQGANTFQNPSGKTPGGWEDR